MKRLIYALSLIVCVLLIPTSVHAYVANLTTGEFLFYDTFQGVDASSSVFPDASGDYDPVAMTDPPSNWACKNEDSVGRQIQVTNSTTSPDVGPSPDYGPNYLRVSRVNADLGDPMPGYLQAEAQYVPAEDGDHIHMAYWINSARPTDCTEINVYQHNGAIAFQLIVDYQGAWVYYTGPGGGNAGFDDVFQERVWQKWEIDYVNGASTIDVSIDGFTQTLPTGAWNLASIAFSQGGVTEADALYVGEVTLPELIVMGSLPGDINNDGVVDADDATILAENWLAQTDPEDWRLAWRMGDFNADGIVDAKDATLLASNWQEPATGASVPEPGLIALLLSGFIGLLIFRNKS